MLSLCTLLSIEAQASLWFPVLALASLLIWWNNQCYRRAGPLLPKSSMTLFLTGPVWVRSAGCPSISPISFFLILSRNSKNTVPSCVSHLDRFPWKMMVQIILICLTTALVFLVITDVSDYRWNLVILWKNLFLTSVRKTESRTETTKAWILLIRNTFMILVRCRTLSQDLWVTTTRSITKL